MRLEHIIHNGTGFAQMTPDELRSAGVPEAVIAAAVAKAGAAAEKTALRGRIAATAGDTQALLGTTADVAALALIASLQLLAAAAESGNAELKKTLAALPIAFPLDKIKAFLAAIETGAIKVPALVKGLDEVLADAAQRATATAEAMQAGETPKG